MPFITGRCGTRCRHWSFDGSEYVLQKTDKDAVILGHLVKVDSLDAKCRHLREQVQARDQQLQAARTELDAVWGRQDREWGEFKSR